MGEAGQRMETLSRTEKRLRVAGALIILGLLVELATLFWLHPLSFMTFLAVGALLLALGVPFYLFTLLQRDRTHEPPHS